MPVTNNLHPESWKNTYSVQHVLRTLLIPGLQGVLQADSEHLTVIQRPKSKSYVKLMLWFFLEESYKNVVRSHVLAYLVPTTE
jgi:hypothetical protein